MLQKKKRAVRKKPRKVNWKKKTWTVFSAFIRKRDKNICVSCGRYAEGSNYHAGHFVEKSQGNSLYFDERNVNGQCYHCNINLGGNKLGYSRYLIGKFGVRILENLERDRVKMVKYTKNDYMKIYEKYKA